ncbi:hypothetical protein [Falsirhodobacter algicola]|uniref:Uncharacterized protein n=1 Tax=Falsirhodobacter algicola TaxID=2692330 RepID=A0A8J8MSR9_9RHOB|nr:hypothetical protein [Falsirhodobacter algicola]QUS36017.1 hypothetical protein GR316_06900 [Falsirhodobacter algicola]
MSGRSSTRTFITGDEVFPALERAFLDASASIDASLRAFDPHLPLHSPEGQAVGAVWFDLIVHVLRRGVRLRLVLADVDPVLHPARHRACWRSVRMLWAAAELAGPAALLEVVAARHPATGGLLPRALCWPAMQRRLGRICAVLNAGPDGLRDLPGLRSRLRQGADGRLHPRRMHLSRTTLCEHHQSLLIFDRARVHVGGPDLADGAGGHDVQVVMEGPVVAEALAHLDSFLAVVEGLRPPAPARRLLRSLSRPRGAASWHTGPTPIVAEVQQAHDALIQRAGSLIYIETPAFGDPLTARRLVRAARANPELQMILILPSPSAPWRARRRQMRLLRYLRTAFGPRLFVGGGEGATSVSIFDDHAAILGSAALDRPGLRWNTEVGVYLNVRRDVWELRRRVMGHWLPADAGAECFSSTGAVRAWAALAARNAACAPQDRSGRLLPHAPG